MSEKQYPPSELRLQRLREQGVVPFSRDLSTFFFFLSLTLVFIGLAITTRIFFGKIGDILPRFWTEQGSAALDISATTAVIVGACLLAILSIRVAVVLLGGLVQNRFLWSTKPLFRAPSLLSIDVLWGAGTRIVEGLLRAIIGIAAVFGGILAVRYLMLSFDSQNLPDLSGMTLAQLLNQQLDVAVRQHVFVLFRVLLTITIALLFLGVFSRLVVVERFRRSHRMSREEVEAEFRETEQSPEMRERQRQREF